MARSMNLTNIHYFLIVEHHKKIFHQRYPIRDVQPERFPQSFHSLLLGKLILIIPDQVTEEKWGNPEPQLSMKFILLINIKMPTAVGILIFISKIYIMLSSVQ